MDSFCVCAKKKKKKESYLGFFPGTMNNLYEPEKRLKMNLTGKDVGIVQQSTWYRDLIIRNTF